MPMTCRGGSSLPAPCRSASGREGASSPQAVWPRSQEVGGRAARVLLGDRTKNPPRPYGPPLQGGDRERCTRPGGLSLRLYGDGGHVTGFDSRVTRWRSSNRKTASVQSAPSTQRHRADCLSGYTHIITMTGPPAFSRTKSPFCNCHGTATSGVLLFRLLEHGPCHKMRVGGNQARGGTPPNPAYHRLCRPSPHGQRLADHWQTRLLRTVYRHHKDRQHPRPQRELAPLECRARLEAEILPARCAPIRHALRLDHGVGVRRPTVPAHPSLRPTHALQPAPGRVFVRELVNQRGNGRRDSRSRAWVGRWRGLLGVFDVLIVFVLFHD